MRRDIVLGNRFVGYVENGVFVTRRSKSMHLFEIWQGLGFNQNLINRFIALNSIKQVTVLYECDSKKKVLLTTPLHIALHAIEWSNEKDLKDSQYVLPLKEFEEKESLQEALIQGAKI